MSRCAGLCLLPIANEAGDSQFRRTPERFSSVRLATAFLSVCCVVICCLSASIVQAQIPTAALFNGETATPVPGAHDYIHLAAETVNPSNGSVNVKFQLPLPKGRGITLPYTNGYNSAGLYHVAVTANSVVTYVQNTRNGGSSYPVATWSVSSITVPSCQPGCGSSGPPPWGPCHVANGFSFTDQNGVSHNLGLGIMTNAEGYSPNSYCPMAGSSNPGYAVPPPGNGDGKVWAIFESPGSTGLSVTDVEGFYSQGAVGPFTVTDKDGTTYFFGGSGMYDPLAMNYWEEPYQIEDRNGNVISSNIDTLGRPMNGTSNGELTVGGLAYPNPTCPACSSTTTVSYAPSYSSAVNTSGLQIGETMSCNPYNMQVTGTQPAETVQTLPTSTTSNPRQFTLYNGTYNPTDSTLANSYGLLNELVYPDGGWVKYTWRMSNSYSGNASTQYASFTGTGMKGGAPDGNTYPNACMLYYSTPVLATRSVSFDGVTVAQTQTFSYTTTMGTYGWTAKQTSVTTTDNVAGTTSLTVYNYLPWLSGPSDPFAWGAVASQIPLEHSILYYSGSTTSTPLLRTVTKTWGSLFDLAEEDTTTDSGQTKKTVYTYDSTDTVSDPFTLLKSKSDYDYGGALIRTTSLQYQSFTANTISVPLGSQYLTYTLPVPSQPSVAIVQDKNNNTVAETDYGYDGFAIAPKTGVVQHDDSNYGTALTNRANLTSITKKCTGCTNPTSTTTYTWDMTGQAASMTDPCGNATCSDMTGSNHTTTYSFSDSWTGSSSPGQTNAYLTQITYPPTGTTAHQSNFQYNYTFGDLMNSTDENGQITSYVYADPFDRLTETDYPDQGKTTVCANDNSQGACYSSTPAPLSVTTTQWITSSVQKTTVAIMDGMFHVVEKELTSDPSGTTYSPTTYDGMGRPRLVYNPTRCNPPTGTCAETTWGYSTTTYDALGRATTIIKQDGSTASTSYTAFPCTTVTDEIGNGRQSCEDGLGRMIKVLEDPGSSPHLNYETDYTYDPLGNLTYVNQQGSVPANARTRTFGYNTLSQLTSAANPESGTIQYNYDQNGNVSSRVAYSPNQSLTTNNVTTAYYYDDLNRLSSKMYTDTWGSNPSTPSVKFGYDGIALTGCTIAPPGDTDTYPIGRSTAMCDGSGGTSWIHDQMGRVKQERRAIGSTAANHYVDYTYNLDGSVKVLQTPPMKQLNYTILGAGRATQLVDSTDNINFAMSAVYAPPGELTGVTLGSGSAFSVSNAYNARLQPILLSAASMTSVFSECFDFHSEVAISTPSPCSFPRSTVGNNGNVYQIVNNRDNTRTQNFMYDSLNRIEQAYSTGSGTYSWGETYSPTATSPGTPPTTLGIDSWGNLIQRSGVTGKTYTDALNCSASLGNQLTGCSLGYDAPGNMTSNTNISATYVYDGENRLVWTSGYRYLYDGNGQRVEKCAAANATTACPTSGTTGTLYWRGTGSDTLAETDLGGNDQEEYIFFNGQRIARRDVNSSGNTIALHYYFSDHLGTHGVVENATGTQCEQDIDYYPFGGQEHDYCTTPVAQDYKYNGKERDTESGLDNFGARFDASNLGRFMTPDWAAKPTAVPYAHYGNPQSLNLYSYVQNNPTTLGDPDGHDGPGDDIVAGLKQTVKDIADGTTFKNALGKVENALGISGGKAVVGGGTITLTATATTGNVTTDSTGKQTINAGPPDASVGLNASIHKPGEEAGPVEVGVSLGHVSVGVTSNSLEVAGSTSSTPKLIGVGSVDKDAVKSAANTLVSAAKKLVVESPPAPKPARTPCTGASCPQ